MYFLVCVCVCVCVFCMCMYIYKAVFCVPTTGSPSLSKRQKIVNEIYSSEQSYISQLSVIIDVSGVYCVQ